MAITVESTHLNGIMVLAPDVLPDTRGFFLEAHRSDRFRELGLPPRFEQENHSGSVRHVIRGLHFQHTPPMGKLMRVIRGTAFLVAVDIRPNSPTLGQWFGIEVSAENKRQVWAPPGFARGFCVLSDFAELQYKCTSLYSPPGETGIRWDDPDVGVEWPIRNPILSDRDARAQTLREWLARPEAQLFRAHTVAAKS